MAKTCQEIIKSVKSLKYCVSKLYEPKTDLELEIEIIKDLHSDIVKKIDLCEKRKDILNHINYILKEIAPIINKLEISAKYRKSEDFNETIDNLKTFVYSLERNLEIE